MLATFILKLREGGVPASITEYLSLLGAMQAGVAFSNASVALVHGMSRPIGAHFHVPHGLSNAMLLPAVTAYSAPAALHRSTSRGRSAEESITTTEPAQA